MADNLSPGASNGDQAKAEAELQRARDHLKAAGSAAADAIRDNVSSAAEVARERARGAKDWARSRLTDLHGRVEERPQSTALWALGIGVVAGFLLGTLFRGGRD